MKNKIVVLNSGGFDSIVLMNYLHFIQEEDNIYSLHFLYGARNEKQQLECVNKVCKKVEAKENKIIQLPDFDWTKGNFYKEGYVSFESQYLEYRNLVFLSYAVSYAQSIGAKEIYCALLKGTYADANEAFIRNFNEVIKESGIVLKAPFSNSEFKDDLIPYFIQTGITFNDYFSCDLPTEKGKPCGYCIDCVAINLIEKRIRRKLRLEAFKNFVLSKNIIRFR